VNSLVEGISAIPGGIALLLLVVFAFLHHRTRDAFFRAWQFAWTAYFISRVSVGIYFGIYRSPWIELISNVGFVVMAICVFRSTRLLHGAERWRKLDSALLATGVVWSGYDVLARALPDRWEMISFGSWRIHHPPVEVAAAPLLAIAGIRFWKQMRDRESVSFRVLAVALWFWAALLGATQFHAFFERIGIWGHVLGPMPQMLLGMAMVMVLYERLANEERRRARYLEFLNNISATAISTSDSSAMLNAISNEIRQNFSFDHIGIGLIDYAQKEIEIRADAGTSATMLGRRVPVDSGIMGRVAHSGEILLLQGSGLRDEALLPNARSVLCAPVVHGGTVLGVLNVESTGENAFRQQEVLIVRTLADLLAAALHNAFVFQGMQLQAITDSLTGTKTRRYFLEALQAEWKRASRSGRAFSIVMVDLDKFKEVNDSNGHMEGDLVVARVGRVLEQHCRQSNVVARYGGDEFVILMPETTLEQSLILSERLRGWLASDDMLQKRGLTGSFGVATFPMHGDSVEAILQAADAALYAAKRRGGNCVETAPQRAGAVV
jgi:diguanylate cyclase (GGDEF)-like protein